MHVPDSSHRSRARTCRRCTGGFAAACLGLLPAVSPAQEFTCPPPLSEALRNLDASVEESPPDTADGRIEIASDSASLGVDGDAELHGNVRIRQGRRELRAEDVSYRAEGGDFEAQGRVEFDEPLVHIAGTGGRYSALRGAQFRSAEFELRERSAHGAAELLELTPQGIINLDEVRFTTCPIEDRAWQIRASSITLDTPARLGTGRGARIDFKGVPIVYLPWVSFPLGAERKSGFLFPSVGHTSRSGAQLSVPYYFNLMPNADFTFEPVYYGRRGLDLSGEARYLTHRHAGEISYNYLPRDELEDRYRAFGRLRHRSELAGDWRLVIDAASASDPEYFEDFGLGPEGTSVIFVERFAQLSYRNETWRLAAQVQQFQVFDRELIEPERPYARVPRLVAGGDFGWGRFGPVRFGFDSELVNFQRNFGVTGWRFDARPAARLELAGPGYFVTPSLAWRFTQYALDDTAPGQPRSPSRALPIASLDAGLVFERLAGASGEQRVTLEPRLLYLYVPYRDQDELPLFDTTVPDLNLPQLFRANRYVGADRVSDANEVSVGVTSRLLDSASGQQYLAATVGQAFYFETPRVQIPGELVERRQRSDLIAQLALTAYRNWNVDLGLQWNPERSGSERSQVNLQYRPSTDQVVNLGYRFQRERLQTEGLEQAEVSAAWPLTRRWHAFARFVYSFQDDQPLERFAGFEYRACCWRLRMVGRRFVSSRTGEEDTAVYLQLELAGLASVGSAADAFLEGAIRGYSRPEVIP